MSGDSSSATITCPRCKQSIPAAGIQAGTMFCCPKCRMDFLVSGRSLGQTPGAEEEYGLHIEPASVPPIEGRKPSDLSAVSSAEETAHAREGAIASPRAASKEKAVDEGGAEASEQTEWRPAKPPPHGLFRSGIFSFLLNIEMQTRLWSLAVAVFIPLFLLAKALELSSAPSMGMESFGVFFSGMFFLVIGGILGVVCLICAAALAMSVLLDTSNGLKRIENWPRGFLVDWMPETGYLLGAIFWSVLPGLPLAKGLAICGIPPVLTLAASMSVFFPLALMAAIEADTFFFPGAVEVWLSPFNARQAWRDFYLITLPLITLITGMAAYASLEGIAWLLAFSSILAAAGWMLYFRLLGRLAWYASGRAETTGE